jgi:hypothetical protein
MSTRPRREHYPTGWSYFWVARAWRKRTGGSPITTAALALIMGGISGSAVLAMLTLMALAPALPSAAHAGLSVGD